MATKEELKQTFVTGAVPTESDFHDLIDVAGSQGPKGEPGSDGDQGPTGETGASGSNGVSVVGATSDGDNIVFEMSDDATIEVPWPTQE
ncbi:hypothetical protein JOC34_002816 [Virgibacillus halotolerans]|uniref:collagen-like triple helix repeat-containing protein n=1 Tax=Virgibacillus halotolerans TaxID=1071053 RepID=UPI001961AF50|nr:collagen-like protein [Virgibacillus halotolerans]MBM7600425.1 hypothetical protein [Virgibacillus halotolerans]